MVIMLCCAVLCPSQASQADPLPPLSEGQVLPLKDVELTAGKTSVSAATGGRGVRLPPCCAVCTMGPGSVAVQWCDACHQFFVTRLRWEIAAFTMLQQAPCYVVLLCMLLAQTLKAAGTGFQLSKPCKCLTGMHACLS